MSDHSESKLRELAYRLVQMAPEAPPFPEEDMVQLRPAPTRSAPPPRRRSPFVLVGAAAFAVLLLLGAPLLLDRLSSDQVTGPATTVPDTVAPTTPPTTPVSTTITPEPAVPTNVTLYFSSADGDLVAVGRVVDAAPDAHSQIAASLEALFAGVNTDDEALIEGVTSAVPAGTSLPSLTTDLTDSAVGTVRVTVSEQFAGADLTAVAQIVYTVTQFGDIDTVTIVDGSDQPVVLADGTVLDDSLTRAALVDALPPVFLDQPPVNGVVSSPFTVGGTANVYELLGRPPTTTVDTATTIGYELVDLNGNVLASGETAAGCTIGCWGGFSAEVRYDVPQVEVGEVVVFGISPQDGSRIGEVRHLVTIEATDVTVGTPPPIGDVLDVDPNALPPATVASNAAVAAVWGSNPAELGRLEGVELGPCCFDVTGDGTVVVNDSQNQRIVVYSSSDDLRVLATFDPADFVPEAIATDGVRVYVLGRSNRTGRPIDLVVLDLGSGEELSRTATSLQGTVDLRYTDAGLYAGLAGSEAQWLPLAEGAGVPIAAVDPQPLPVLPAETALVVAHEDTSVLVSVTPAGDSPTTTYRIPTEGMTVDIITVPGSPDANGVAVWMTPDLTGSQPSTVVVLGTDRGRLVGQRFDVEVPRTVQVGPFNTFRYAFGGLYLMSATDTGVTITRYELP